MPDIFTQTECAAEDIGRDECRCPKCVEEMVVEAEARRDARRENGI